MPTPARDHPVSPNNPVVHPARRPRRDRQHEALELDGITKDTPNPEGGVIVRTQYGEATGLLLQNAANLVRKIVPPTPRPSFPS